MTYRRQSGKRSHSWSTLSQFHALQKHLLHLSTLSIYDAGQQSDNASACSMSKTPRHTHYENFLPGLPYSTSETPPNASIRRASTPLAKFPGCIRMNAKQDQHLLSPGTSNRGHGVVRFFFCRGGVSKGARAVDASHKSAGRRTSHITAFQSIFLCGSGWIAASIRIAIPKIA